MKETNMNSKLLTVKEVCSMFGISRWTVHRWIQEKRINVIRIDKIVRIPKSEVSKLIKSGSDGKLDLKSME